MDRVGNLERDSGAVSFYLIIFVGLIYLAIAISELAKGNYPMAATFAGYAFSNAGLAVMAR